MIGVLALGWLPAVALPLVAPAAPPPVEPARPPEASAPRDAPPAEPFEADPPFEPAEPMGTRVNLVGGPPGQLELFLIDPEAGRGAVGTIDGIPYRRVCRAPCRTAVSLEEGEYFVAGAKVMPSRRFTLDEHAGRPAVRLDVRPGPRAIRFTGFGLLVGGAILAPGGGLLVGAVHREPASNIAGFVLIGTGVVAVITGIALVVRGRTLVRIPG